MLSSATRLVLIIWAIAFATSLLYIVYSNATDKDVIMPITTAVLWFFSWMAWGFFSWRKPEAPTQSQEWK